MRAVIDLDTPAVTVDLNIMQENIRRVHEYFSRHQIAIRPHIKTHKIPAIARLQMEAGAVGITCQKLGEAEVFATAGIAEDILLTYNILGRQKTERLAALAKRLRRLTVVLDNEVVAREVSEACVRHGVDMGFLAECDTGSGRNGVQTPEAALDLARFAMKLPRLDFQGIMTFPIREPDSRLFFERTLELFKRAGIPVPIVSGGFTPMIFKAQDFPMLTEYRPGTYIFNDVRVVTSGTATWDNCALRVRTTVVSRPTPARAILDAGSKVLTSDHPSIKGYGHIVEYPDADITTLWEEHAVVDLSSCRERPQIGEVVNVISNHCCVVTNMVDEIYGVRGGGVEVVWPVLARGKVQ